MKIREAADLSGMTASKFLSRICKWYFDEKWASEKPKLEAQLYSLKRLKELRSTRSRTAHPIPEIDNKNSNPEETFTN